MTIKPEDVTQELLELAMERFENAYWNDVSPEQVALFLQDAIDLGLVSPPCWEVVGDDYRISMVFKRKESAERWKASDNGFDKTEVRHWKGQTE